MMLGKRVTIGILFACFAINVNATVIYDFVVEDGTVLGSLGLSETEASATQAWGPSNDPYLIESFIWFDDNSGKTNFTGLFETGVHIPREAFSLTGEFIDSARFQVDTNLYTGGIPGDWYAPLSYDIFENTVFRNADNNGRDVEYWNNGKWWERSHRLAATIPEPNSIMLFFLGLVGFKLRFRK